MDHYYARFCEFSGVIERYFSNFVIAALYSSKTTYSMIL